MHRIVAAIVLALVLPSICFAEFRAHDWEVTLAVTGSSDNSFDNFAIGGTGSIGFFLTDQIEIALRETASYSDVGNGSSTTTADTQLAADFHFSFGEHGWLQPFVGGNVGYSYTDFSTDTFEAGPEAGVKFFVNSTTFIFVLVEYEFPFSNSGGSDDDDGQFTYRLGVGFRF